MALGGAAVGDLVGADEVGAGALAGVDARLTRADAHVLADTRAVVTAAASDDQSEREGDDELHVRSSSSSRASRSATKIASLQTTTPARATPTATPMSAWVHASAPGELDLERVAVEAMHLFD